MRHSEEPLLLSLDFKIYQGDSLVQKIGTKLFPLGVFGSATSQVDFLFIEELSRLKEDYFYNRLKDKSLIQNKMTEFHSNLIEKELKQLHKKLKQLSGIGHQTQDNLIEATPTRKISKAEQKKIDAEREYLQSEIEELQNQLLSLHSHNQFIWDIHFMEIFDSQGGFNLVIGNPPYVRQEEFAGKYKDALIDMMSFEYPNLKIDQKSDLYIYFYLKDFKLLNPKGILTYICSNSWLDVNYGVALQSVFLNQGIIDCIIDNRSKRSFKSADINTIISIIKRKHIDDLTKPMAKFIAFKRPFEEDTNALKYIEWGESKGFHEKPTCIVRQKWWDLGNRIYSNFFCSQIFNDRFAFFSNNNFLVDCVLNEGFSDNFNLTLFLNSTFTSLFIETTGRSGLGEGALKVQVSDFRNILVIKPEFLDFSNFNHEVDEF